MNSMTDNSNERGKVKEVSNGDSSQGKFIPFQEVPQLEKIDGIVPESPSSKEDNEDSTYFETPNDNHAHDEQKHEDEFEDSVAPLLNIDKYVNKKSPLYQHLITHTNSFHITGKIGKGGFGSVVRATHKLDNNEYAIKTIKLHLGLEQDVRNHKVLREVHTMTAVTNQNVVRYIT